jgi:hypothetical protein
MSGYRHLLGTFALAATCASPAAGALYKWTDAQGHIMYSDQPPAANVKTEQLRAPPPAANPNAAKEFAQREAEYKKKQADAAEAAAKADRERVDAGKLVEVCAQARGQLKQLNESQLAVIRYNEKGEREVMDDDARGKERAKINAFLRDNKCPS